MSASRVHQQGVSLIELLIGLTLGLVVLAGVTGFIGTLVSTNTSTIQTTKLNQELRSITEIVAREIRRSRAVNDPIGFVGQGAGAVNNYQTFSPVSGAAAASCARYAYQWASDGNPYRAISLDTTTGLIRIASAATAANWPTCTTAGTTISSTLVNVTGLSFQTVGNRVDISVTGRLRTGSNPVARTFTTSVYLRSGAI